MPHFASPRASMPLDAATADSSTRTAGLSRRRSGGPDRSRAKNNARRLRDGAHRRDPAHRGGAQWSEGAPRLATAIDADLVS
jgi:hypothetical protein